MGNEVALKKPQELSPYAAFAAEGEAQAIAGKLLVFSKGFWYSGQERDAVKTGKSFVCNMPEFYLGFVKWQNQAPVDMRLERLADRSPHTKPIFREDLGDNDPSLWDRDSNGKPRDPWQPTRRLVMRAYKAADIDLYTFTTSSGGGQRALRKLCGEYEQMRRKHGADMLPVVTIGSESWQHKDKAIGMVQSPTFEVVGCTTWEPGGKVIKIEKDAPVTAAKIKEELDDEIPF